MNLFLIVFSFFKVITAEGPSVYYEYIKEKHVCTNKVINDDNMDRFGDEQEKEITQLTAKDGDHFKPNSKKQNGDGVTGLDCLTELCGMAPSQALEK